MVGEGVGRPELIQPDPPLKAEVKPPAARAKGKTKEGEPGLDLTHQDTWGRYLALAFNSLAQVTGHDHWEKTDAEIDFVAIPAARIAREQVPKEVLERMQRGQNWVALFVGIALLVLPSLLAEWRLYQQSRQPAVVTRSEPAPAGVASPPPATADVGSRNGSVPEANPRGPLANW